MKLFEKLEDILNAILIKIGQFLLKLVPKGVKQKFEKWGKFSGGKSFFFIFFFSQKIRSPLKGDEK